MGDRTFFVYGPDGNCSKQGSYTAKGTKKADPEHKV